MSEPNVWPEWDGKDITDGLVLIGLTSGMICSVSNHKTKNPYANKNIRVSKKLPDGLYEFTMEGLRDAQLSPRKVLGHSHLLGLFPMTDRRNYIRDFETGLTSHELTTIASAVFDKGLPALLLKIVKKDTVHPGMAHVSFQVVVPKKENKDA